MLSLKAVQVQNDGDVKSLVTLNSREHFNANHLQQMLVIARTRR